MQKHVQVTDMTFGQLYDAVANGGKFYCESEPVIVNEYGYLTASPLLQTGLVGALISGQITRLVEIPWTDRLDGTWENGVWCMTWDNGDVKKCVAKISKYDECDYITNAGAYFHNAKPLPQDLAEQLESLSKQ